jgi:hypothetical protein
LNEKLNESNENDENQAHHKCTRSEEQLSVQPPA